MNNIKKSIAEYVDIYLDEYYPQQQEGQFTGDAERLAANISKELSISEAEARRVIDEMIQSGELITDSAKWVNPENDQRTIYVDIITTKNFKLEDDGMPYVRHNQSSWGYAHPDSFKSYPSVAEFVEGELENIQNVLNNIDENSETAKFLRSVAEDLGKMKTWDDIPTVYDIQN